MYWKIDRDYLVDGEIITETRVGTKVGEKQNAVGKIMRFRLLDDDLEVYYGGEADDDGLESVFDFAQRDAGTTLLETRFAEDDEWHPVIG